MESKVLWRRGVIVWRLIKELRAGELRREPACHACPSRTQAVKHHPYPAVAVEARGRAVAECTSLLPVLEWMHTVPAKTSHWHFFGDSSVEVISAARTIAVCSLLERWRGTSDKEPVGICTIGGKSRTRCSAPQLARFKQIGHLSMKQCF